VVIAPASRTEDPGFESRQGARLLRRSLCIAVLLSKTLRALSLCALEKKTSAPIYVVIRPKWMNNIYVPLRPPLSRESITVIRVQKDPFSQFRSIVHHPRVLQRKQRVDATVNRCLQSRVARWFAFKPKIQIWVNFGGSCNGRGWYILWFILQSFVIFYGHLV
jgi:hypothetical protein